MTIKGKGETVIIEFECWRAVIDTHGAHVLTFSRGGESFLFYDENDIGHSGIPICLPFFGPLSTPYTHNGATYGMGQHGFFRDRLFSVVSFTESSVVLELKSDAQTKALYPFDFSALVTVSLGSFGLDLKIAIENRSAEPLPFAPGLHPYFAVNNPAALRIATPAVRANNNLAGYAEESVTAAGFLTLSGEIENNVPLYAVSGAPDFHLIDHSIPWTLLRDGSRKIFIDADPAVFNRLTIWRKNAESSSFCVEPSSVKNRLNDDPILVAVGERFETSMRIWVG